VGISVVGVTRDLKEAPDKISSSEPDILLTDCLTTEGGEALLSGLYERFPQVRTVLFGMREDFQLFLKAVYSGVVGYLLTDVSASEMIAAVREIAQGKVVCPPKLLVNLLHHLARQSRAMPEFYQVPATNKPPLTYRQLELVNLVAKGMTNKEIATKLNLSEFTVKNHIRRILKQVDAEDRQEAVNVIRATGYLTSA
jgi:two-component system NarL family response regulator